MHARKVLNVKQKGSCILILAPTRELAQQINQVCSSIRDNTLNKLGTTSVCLFGGVPKGPQIAQLKRMPNIIVATPGRLIDLVDERQCNLSNVSYIVLDEADRMLDLGFEPAIRKIFTKIKQSNERQTLMFSATWPQEIQNLASEFLNNPINITIGSTNLSGSSTVRQIVELIDSNLKLKRLQDLLREYHDNKNKIIIFALYKKETAWLESQLLRYRWKAVAIHGDLTQQQRDDAIANFKSGLKPLLIATDVAARGLDIPNVEAVINFTFPLTVEDYVHRIGRTGRAGKAGLAHTFFTIQEKKLAGDLVNVLKETNQVVPPEIEAFGPSVKKKQEHEFFGAHFKESNDEQTFKKATHKKFD
eukprot:TRINITY_DN322_c1_g1_i5.p1 TRINITY_DN322_c1_g1~~TRINITY_DN322_c1_g1_i5.p1  ORF type:complete len:361 (-),score=188.68 TRINITY_DN322_c1_g1_i5:121-1203(-)